VLACVPSAEVVGYIHINRLLHGKMKIKRYMFRMFMFICYVQGSQVS